MTNTYRRLLEIIYVVLGGTTVTSYAFRSVST